MADTRYFENIIFGFIGPENRYRHKNQVYIIISSRDIKKTIHFSIKWQPCWKNKMADTRYFKIFVIFGFLGPENIGVDTKIKFLSLLLAEI